MKCIILAGGKGTRLTPLTDNLPKPLIEIGGIPILYHIIQRLRMQGVEDFVVAGGYKWEMIRNYVAKYPMSGANVVVEDTGLESLTGERLKMVAPKDGEIIVTYGDDISNIDIRKTIKRHKEAIVRPCITITAARAQSNWGHLEIDRFTTQVVAFKEKPYLNDWINAGNWVLDSKLCETIRSETLEQWCTRILNSTAVNVALYDGFFCGMNTYADYIHLNDLWDKYQDWQKVSL